MEEAVAVRKPAGWRLGKTCALVVPSGRSSLLLCLSVLFGSSTDWVRPTFIGEGHRLYSVNQLKCDLLQRLSQTPPGMMSDQTSGHLSTGHQPAQWHSHSLSKRRAWNSAHGELRVQPCWMDQRINGHMGVGKLLDSASCFMDPAL